MKKLDTLIEDIHALFPKQGHKVNEDNLNSFMKNIGEIVKARLEENRGDYKNHLRMSKIGKPNRQLYFDLKDNANEEGESFKPSTLIKFMYGDLIEQFAIFLAKEAGHTVEDEQKEVSINGVIGHIDVKLDGVMVDIKSTSKYAFPKFSKGTLHQDDPFGYIAQISGYKHAEKTEECAFWAINKETGEMAILNIDQIDLIDPEARIEEIKEMLSKDTPPVEKCYAPVPDGASGNMKLASNCGWCSFKEQCWSDSNNGQGLRKFRYSNGIQYFTEVSKEPRVEEII